MTKTLRNRINRRFTAAVIFCACSSLFSAELWSQDFSAINKDLEQLESLIADTLLNTEEYRKLLADLQKNLDESGNIIIERENLLLGLQERLNEMSEIYRMQSALSAKYEKNSKFWRTFTLIAIPVTAVLSGSIAWAAGR